MKQVGDRPRTLLLPDPDPREVHYTVISTDDHLVEPPDMFEGRLPHRWATEAPRIALADDGAQPWLYEGEILPQMGSNAVVGQADRTNVTEPGGFDDMRKGAWDVHERIRDMDLNGIWASVNFPSIISGFCGTVFSRSKDPALGLAVTRAWNDWMFEAWHGAYPERLVPMGITWLADPNLGAQEIVRNAERGFTAVTLPEQPHRLGYPSLHSGHWDPVLRACEETDTVICLHVGSSGLSDRAPDAPAGLGTTLFPVLSLQASADWVWSGVTVRFPGLKINLAEGGIGWVPMLLDRLDYVMDHAGGTSHGFWSWEAKDITPSETLLRNFWFSTLDDPSTLELRHRTGIDHIMVEVDYPHADSTWPDTQELLLKRFGELPVDEIRKMTHENAAKLFRHPLPSDVRP
jgi:predicted TIM-barrel fold metal-dependent hydrolase